MRHVHWTCDGCDKKLSDQPVRVTLKVDGTQYHDREDSFDLCGSCIARVGAMAWPDQWARPEIKDDAR